MIHRLIGRVAPWVASVGLLGVLVAMAVVGPAFADSPHFLTASAQVTSSGQLSCSFKEVGLGNTATVANITCSASATAVYACINGGNNHPQAVNKESSSGLVSKTGSFTIRNGQTTGALLVNPPAAGPFQPACNPPMTVVLVSVCYNNITLSGKGASVNLGSKCLTLRPDLA
jgi:hypothetical protein